MASRSGAPLVLVAAGGTGGHLFPAEALSEALQRRGIAVALATDRRAAKLAASKFGSDNVHIVESATLRGRDPFSIAATLATLALGTGRAFALLGRLQPAAVVGFGGYPSVPPLLAASLRKIPTLIHEQNGVIGRANRFLSSRATAIATGFPGILDHNGALAKKAVYVGNPVRPAVVAVAQIPYEVPAAAEMFRLLIFGGSQGARVMADIAPAAIERLEPRLQMRLRVAQQAREEDLDQVRKAYARLQVEADIAPFFPDLPARMAASHLVVSRSGASTVAELAAIGRPAILVPLPHALDQDQAANARVLEEAGGAIRVSQDAFTPDRLAAEIAALAGDPARLSHMAQAAKSAGMLDAADQLADLVIKIARVGR
jgi:UDP-N-acetylglucosamine--N-acetylmuramyl-(pentapeptide) pyrophosphoryl-undecaprenol N-acetylglucosamine transferase